MRAPDRRAGFRRWRLHNRRAVGEPTEPTPSPRPSASGSHLIAGDPLRALACFGVFVFHAGYFAVLGSGYGRLLVPDADSRRMFGPILNVAMTSLGTVVPVFFCLSAYLISRPFFRAFIDGTRPPSIPSYLRHRVFRIVPACWVIFTVTVLAWGMHRAGAHRLLAVYGFSADWKSTPFATIFGQSWTLNVEVRFYAAIVGVAVVLMLLRRPLRTRRWSRALLLIAVALAASAWSLLTFQATASASALGFPSQLYAFAPGLLFAALEPVLSQRIRDGRLLRLCTTSLVVAALAYLVTASLVLPRFCALTGLGGILGGRLSVSICLVAMMGSVLLRQWAGAGCWRGLDNAPLRWLGTRSYSFYLMHFAILRALAFGLRGIGGYKVEMLVLLPLAFVVTGVLAEVAYRAIEYPAMRLGRGRRARPMPLPQPAAPATHAPGAISPPDPIGAVEAA